MNPLEKGKRTLLDFLVASGIAVALILLNLLINFSDAVHAFLAVHARSQVALVIFNFLFLWLAVLLVLAFSRWREAVRRQAELEDVVSSISPDALLVVSPDRTIVMCTSAVRRMFGYDESEVLQKKTDLLYYDRRTSREHPREIYEALEKEGFHIGTATGRRKDGGTLPLEIIAGDLHGRGGVVLLLRDISERIKLQEHKRRLDESSMRADKLESLGVLASGAAHDFNNMLMVIQGYAELTSMNPAAPDLVRDNMNEIRGAAHRAMELCERLMSFAGETERVLAPVALSDLVRDAGGVFEASLDDRVSLEYDLAADLPRVRGDASQIKQVFMNLAANARDALGSERGAIRISARCRVCDAECLSDALLPVRLEPGRYICLDVTDTGCGMSESTIARICDPFFTTKIGRDGLGLAAVLGIVRAHGGTLKVKSSPGEGSTFTVLFPVAESD